MVWTILKSLWNVLQYYFWFCFFYYKAGESLAPQPQGLNPQRLHWEARSSSLDPREVPASLLSACISFTLVPFTHPPPPIKETLLSQASLRQSGADCSCTCEFQVSFPSCRGLLSPTQWFSVHRIVAGCAAPGWEHAFVEARCPHSGRSE